MSKLVIWKITKDTNPFRHHLSNKSLFLDDLSCFTKFDKIYGEDEFDSKDHNVLILPLLNLRLTSRAKYFKIKDEFKKFIIVIAYFREWHDNIKFNDDLLYMYNSYGNECTGDITLNTFDYFYRDPGNLNPHNNILLPYKQFTKPFDRKNKFYKLSIVFGRIDENRPNKRRFWKKFIKSSLFTKDDIVSAYINLNDPAETKLVEDNLHNVNIVYDAGFEWSIPEKVQNSCVNVVIETQPYLPFYTEKTLKPIIQGMPFIWLAKENFLNVLSDLGYKTYDFIDYSFDSIECFEKRMDALLAEMNRLYALDLNSIINDYQHIAEHNKRVFQSKDLEKEFRDELSKAIRIRETGS